MDEDLPGAVIDATAGDTGDAEFGGQVGPLSEKLAQEQLAFGGRVAGGDSNDGQLHGRIDGVDALKEGRNAVRRRVLVVEDQESCRVINLRYSDDIGEILENAELQERLLDRLNLVLEWQIENRIVFCTLDGINHGRCRFARRVGLIWPFAHRQQGACAGRKQDQDAGGERGRLHFPAHAHGATRVFIVYRCETDVSFELRGVGRCLTRGTIRCDWNVNLAPSTMPPRTGLAGASMVTGTGIKTDPWELTTSAAALLLLAGDAVWYAAGSGVLSGTKQGRDAVLAYFGELGARSQGSFQASVTDIVGGENHTVAIQQTRATGNGKTMDLATAIAFVARDGKIIEGREFSEDTAKGDDFWA